MSGIGIMRMGTSPYGLGTPATSSANSGVVLPNDYGETQGSRYVNPVTRQYEYGSDGRAVGQNNAQHLVQMAFLTLRGSSAMTSLGILAPSGVVGANFVARRKTEVNQALSDLVRASLIEILSIEVNVKNRPVLTLVRWRDLTTQLEQESLI